MSDQVLLALIGMLGGIISSALTAMFLSWGKSKDRAEDRLDKAAAAALLKELNAKVDGALRDRDMENEARGERKEKARGVETAATMAEGIEKGAEIARASAEQAKTNTGAALGLGAVPAPAHGPVPVTDKNTAAGVAQVVEAIKDVASGLSNKA